MDYFSKYIKYKTKYNNLKKLKFGGSLTVEEQKSFNEANRLVKEGSLDPKHLYKFDNNSSNDPDMINVIAIKGPGIVDPTNPGYLGNIGPNINNNIVIGQTCKDKPFDIGNKPWCYFFVTFYEELVTLLKEKNINTELRLKELFGLKDEWGPYTHFVILSVKKLDLFRPCYDKPGIDEIECSKTPKNIGSEYNEWLENFKANSIKEKVPFTSLGYTADWKPSEKNIQGVTELVIVPGSRVSVNFIGLLSSLFESLGIQFSSN